MHQWMITLVTDPNLTLLNTNKFIMHETEKNRRLCSWFETIDLF